MKCIFCKGNLVEKKVQKEVKVGGDYFLVPLQAEVCEQCHETYFAEGTVDYIQQFKKTAKAKKSLFTPIGQVFQPAFA